MLPLEAGERGPTRPCGYAEPQLGERDGAHSSIPLRGLAQVPFHCQARGMKGCKGCSTDVTCWGSVALASKCHVWQLVRSSLPHQLAGGAMVFLLLSRSPFPLLKYSSHSPAICRAASVLHGGKTWPLLSPVFPMTPHRSSPCGDTSGEVKGQPCDLQRGIAPAAQRQRAFACLKFPDPCVARLQLHIERQGGVRYGDRLLSYRNLLTVVVH
ncbi:hypothetical protein Q8A67_019255 [Cirrhinus molitorella]|uniref:Uncharacterized protein n=1 Tax=Cirrhinus molitorella TaxID=172907 RepID=A0AA88PDN2_9TELE|nr:hypothetical protein Q8A67_019255 [Cirrhinus molitorella]